MNGVSVFSKLETGSFPSLEEVVRVVEGAARGEQVRLVVVVLVVVAVVVVAVMVVAVMVVAVVVMVRLVAGISACQLS